MARTAEPQPCSVSAPCTLVAAPANNDEENKAPKQGGEPGTCPATPCGIGQAPVVPMISFVNESFEKPTDTNRFPSLRRPPAAQQPALALLPAREAEKKTKMPNFVYLVLNVVMSMFVAVQVLHVVKVLMRPTAALEKALRPIVA